MIPSPSRTPMLTSITATSSWTVRSVTFFTSRLPIKAPRNAARVAIASIWPFWPRLQMAAEKGGSNRGGVKGRHPLD